MTGNRTLATLMGGGECSHRCAILAHDKSGMFSKSSVVHCGQNSGHWSQVTECKVVEGHLFPFLKLNSGLNCSLHNLDAKGKVNSKLSQ